MSEIRFEEEQAIKKNMKAALQKKRITFLGKFLIKLSGGQIKDQKQINKIFVIIIVILFIYNVYLMITY